MEVSPCEITMIRADSESRHVSCSCPCCGWDGNPRVMGLEWRSFFCLLNSDTSLASYLYRRIVRLVDLESPSMLYTTPSRLHFSLILA